MWYQVSQDQSFVIVGALARYRDDIAGALNAGTIPAGGRDQALRDLCEAMELIELFYDDGSLDMPRSGLVKYLNL